MRIHLILIRLISLKKTSLLIKGIIFTEVWKEEKIQIWRTEKKQEWATEKKLVWKDEVKEEKVPAWVEKYVKLIQ